MNGAECGSCGHIYCVCCKKCGQTVCKCCNEEAEDLIESAFLQLAHLCEDGWYDTMAISTTRDLGDYLVKKGKWERRSGGLGRRWFYRPKAENKNQEIENG